MKGIVISVAMLLVGFSVASAQSLAELAEKEKERREAIGQTKGQTTGQTTGKTYDDAALAVRRRATPPDVLASERSAGTEPAETTESAEEGEENLEGEPSEEEDPTQTQAYWRDRKAAIDRRIADIQARLNEPGFASDPDNLMRRNQLEQQLEQARSDLAALQAEARSQGVPPGWVR
ncbi:MAG TPA: hypothetical protein VGC53_15580 [Vicinamibacteria bacterium]|jgi:hypothetical protein